MKFQVLILGANSALPGPGRFPSSQVIFVQDRLYLLDCGEGAQIKMTEFGVRRSRINQIFISHLHGDHVFGLPGLVSSYNLLDRQEPLQIFGPPGIDELVESIFRLARIQLKYELRFHIVDPESFQPVFEDDVVKVITIPLQHRVPTCGYLIQEKPKPRNIKPEMIKRYNLSYDQIRAIKGGKDLQLSSSEMIANKELTIEPKEIRQYAYCTDTSYDRKLAKRVEGVNTLYHEATYTHDMVHKASDRGHSTAMQAAMIAKAANVDQLIIGHYSSRYQDLEPLIAEARAVFEKSEIAVEGARFDV